MLTVFTNNKREGINTFVCAVSLYVAESPKASIKEHELALPIMPFGIVAYGFVGQPFSKQLYIKIQPKTIDLSTRLLGINPTNSHKLCIYYHEPRTEASY